MFIKYLAIILVSSMVAISSNAVLADNDSEQDQALKLRLSGKILSLEKILKELRTVHSGKILEAELEEKHGQYIYEIEILAEDGVVWELKYDAQTAQLISTEKED